MTSWTGRSAAGGLFVLACALGSLAPTLGLMWRFAAALAGMALGAGMVAIWGPRTRPAATGRWTVVGLLAIVAIALSPSWLAPGLAAMFVAMFVLHDHPAGPGAVLVLGMTSVLWQDSGIWSDAGDAEAWWLGGAVCALVAAAVLERERLAAAAGTPTHPAGTAARIGWVAAWTAGFLLAREALAIGSWALAAGLDVARTSGRIALVALILLGVAGAGLLLRGRSGPAGKT